MFNACAIDIAVLDYIRAPVPDAGWCGKVGVVHGASLDSALQYKYVGRSSISFDTLAFALI